MIVRNTNLLVQNLYYLLWLKDSGLKDASFEVKIPDTLVIHSGKIMNWFLSSKENAGVLMKKEANLKKELIFESFTRKDSRSGIVAYFIENQKDEHSNPEEDHFHNAENTDKVKVKFDIPKEEGHIIVRYLTKESLKSLLFD